MRNRGVPVLVPGELTDEDSQILATRASVMQKSYQQSDRFDFCRAFAMLQVSGSIVMGVCSAEARRIVDERKAQLALHGAVH